MLLQKVILYQTGSASCISLKALKRLVKFIQKYVVAQGHILIMKEILKFHEDFKREENEPLENQLTKIVKAQQ